MIETVATGFRYPEGPAFDSAGNLFLVELGAGRVSRVADDGSWSTFAETGGSPNGSAFAADGSLYVCNNGGKHPPAPSTDDQPGADDGTPSIQRVAPDGTVSVVVDSIDGVGLNAPNDLCCDAQGGLYFTDPTWVFSDDGMAGPGTICYIDSDGKASRVHTGLRFPNGIGLGVGGTTLYVTESSTGDVWWFPVNGPGIIGEPNRFASCGPGSLPDGFAIDVDGTLLVASHGFDHLCVFGADRTVREPVALGSNLGLSNLCFGGPDRTTLYITAAAPGVLLRTVWSKPGLPMGHE